MSEKTKISYDVACYALCAQVSAVTLALSRAACSLTNDNSAHPDLLPAIKLFQEIVGCDDVMEGDPSRALVKSIHRSLKMVLELAGTKYKQLNQEYASPMIALQLIAGQLQATLDVLLAQKTQQA